MVRYWSCNSCEFKGLGRPSDLKHLPRLDESRCPHCNSDISWTELDERFDDYGERVANMQLLVNERKEEELEEERVLDGFLDRALHRLGVIDGITVDEKKERKKRINIIKSSAKKYKTRQTVRKALRDPEVAAAKFGAD